MKKILAHITKAMILISFSAYASPPVEPGVRYWNGKYFYRSNGINSPKCNGYQGSAASFRQVSATIEPNGDVVYVGFLSAPGFTTSDTAYFLKDPTTVRISKNGSVSVSYAKTASYKDNPPTLNMSFDTSSNYCHVTFENLVNLH